MISITITYRYGFTNHVFEVQELLNSAMRDLFTKIQSTEHCCIHCCHPREDVVTGQRVMIVSLQIVRIIFINSLML